MRMRNRKLHNIRPSRAFSRELDISGSVRVRMPNRNLCNIFPRFFLTSCSSIVQVAWLLTCGQRSGDSKGAEKVYACATRSSAISHEWIPFGARMRNFCLRNIRPFHRKLATGSDGFPRLSSSTKCWVFSTSASYI